MMCLTCNLEYPKIIVVALRDNDGEDDCGFGSERLLVTAFSILLSLEMRVGNLHFNATLLKL